MSRNPPISLRLLPLALAIVAPLAMASTSAPSALPQVDFSKMGAVGLGGSFAGLDWWSSSSPFASGSSGHFSTTGDTLLMQGSDGSITALGSTNAGGKIEALCWTNSTANGTVYIGGSFSSIGGVSSANIIAYDTAFHAVSPGLSGPVNSLYCDNAHSQVWVGGSFNAPTGSGGNVALWSTTSSSWSSVEFGGLNGPVDSISSSANGSSIYFAGSFTTTFLSNSSSTLNSTNVTSIPSAPSNTTTTGNSGYLTPVTLPSVSSSTGNLSIVAGPSTSNSQYDNPNVLLCPGEGVWMAQDNTISNVDLLGYNYWRATGVRVTNGLVDGRGATTFCITSLPDNTQLNMTYTDPTTGKNETCWEYCPLYTDPSIGAQDFVFTTGTRNLTGLQMQLKGWIGNGAALSSVQLLSDGASGSAVTSANTGGCSGSSQSSAQTTGDWTTHTISSDIPATLASYISSTVPVSDPTHPSVTFYPYISSAAYYDVYVVIPGCIYTQDCDSRTSVDIEVFPAANGLGWTSTISEHVTDDTKTLVYSGWMDATSGSFTPTIILALAQSPAAASSSNYVVVAEAVELVLTGIATNGSTTSTSGGSNGTNSTTTSSSTSSNSTNSVAFGVFEWARSSNSTVNAATSSLSNSTETALTKLGFALDAAYNTSGSKSWSVNAIAATGSNVFVGGNFSVSGNYTNVVSLDISSGQSASLASGGLNGVVHAATVLGNYVYFGGEFTTTASSGTALKSLARYDPSGKAWSAIGGGVDGAVTGLVASGSSLIVTGNFSNVISSGGNTTSTGGYAVWDTSSSSWTTGAVIFGNLSAATASSSNTYLGGRVYGSTTNGVSGIAFLTSSGSSAAISSLPGVSLAATGSGSTTPSKRSFHAPRSLAHDLFARIAGVLSEPSIVARASAPTISSVSAPAPAVLAGGFYTNSSASGKPSVSVFGGNFTSGSSIGALAFYANGALSGPTPPVQGVVHSLAVVGDYLYAGGTSLNVSTVGSGLVVYNLAQGKWVTGTVPSLNPSSGTTLNVNVIKQRLNSNTVVVGGNFATAGSLGCSGLCLWDTGSGQWSAPGSGLSSGEIKAVDFAGDSYDTLFVAGSFILSSGDVAYAAKYSFDNSTWTPLGTLPGPALTIAVDNKNASNVFAAGYGSDGAPYLQAWDGSAWSAQNASLLSGSIVSSLAFVPMSTEHTATGAIEGDRMLMVSGNLYLENTGNVTSALYDGADWYPYLVGTSSSGGLGSASSLFWSESNFSFSITHYLARGLVVLVAIAIATGLILLLVLLFFLIALCLRRRERSHPRQEVFDKDPGSDVSSTHQHVFNNVQAALEQTLVGGSAGTAIAAATGTGARRSEESAYASDNDEYAAGGGAGGVESDEEGRETTMRYDFDGPELQPGEMSMRAGQRVVIHDDVQSDEWWYARDPATGREGVVPATYVW